MARLETLYRVNDQLQGSALPTQTLCAILVIPNAWLGELELYLGESLFLSSKVKDTPEARLFVREYLLTD